MQILKSGITKNWNVYPNSVLHGATTITYQGKDWPVREIEIDGNMEQIATEELEMLLISPDGTPKSDEACRVDSVIYFYAPKHWLEIYDDAQLTALVLQETR